MNDAVAVARHVHGGQLPAGHVDLLPLVIYAAIVVALLAIVLVMSWLLGARDKPGFATNLPFESGIASVGSASTIRISVSFYLVAMSFVIFDLDAAFLYVWAVSFKHVGWQGYVGGVVFIVILFAGLLYEVTGGAFSAAARGRFRRLHDDR